MTDYFDYVRSLFEGEKREAPLKGLRVVEVTHFIFGPNVGRILAQFGAEVVKVETPGEGDRFRFAAVWGRFYKKLNLVYGIINANKYIIAADARNKRARELIFELVKRADVFVENLRAGLAEAMGIGYSTVSKVNPGIIYVSCSGYGQYGPLSKAPSFDIAAQGVSSIATKTGWEEIDEFYKLPDYFGDYLPSMIAVASILAALHERDRTGKGVYIDISQAEALLRFLYDITYYSITGEEIGKTGNIDPTASPSGIFKTSDGKFVAIAVMNEKQFSALAKVVDGLKDGNRLKKERIKELNEIVERWVSSHTLDEIMGYARELGFPASPVLEDMDIYQDKWRRERGSVVRIKDRLYGELDIPGAVIAMSSTPGETKWLGRPVGYHNRLILKKWLGLSNEEIAKLEEEDVIGYWDEMPGTSPPPTWSEDDPVFRGERDEE
ncbi:MULTISPECIES: CaiB/BaiF CoA transferase family protein [unclassified Archaeoglobus]|jgi:crotonobetainyl-CoA:carnitine CoA-transferase CaiB-like acyl-CoA transferase|uniref:CaiB/BaiF CoA transferase family protein n=1 Tax=unclassified Archaeoglobus TaxID=2643606 RepID=UPI0025C5CE99|nr:MULTISPECIES: CoA transferase [unclassified Archaeoglobus]